MICVRCLNSTASKVAEAPDGSRAWEIYYCGHCNYSWRSSEESCVVNIDERDPRFQLNDVDLDNLFVHNTIPPLKKPVK